MSAPVMEVVRTVSSSPYFWSQTVPMLCGALLTLTAMAVVVLRAHRRIRLRLLRLASAEEGSAAAMDFVLTFPILMLVGFMFIQFLLGAHASLVVHYAAYSAARTARTAIWETTINDVRKIQALERLYGDGNERLKTLQRLGEARLNTSSAQRRALESARLVLMSATPSSFRQAASTVSPAANAALKTLHATGVSMTAARRKAAYVSTAGNVRVRVDVVDRFELAAIARSDKLRIDALPIVANVEFKYPLTMPVSRLFATPAGASYRWLAARVELL